MLTNGPDARAGEEIPMSISSIGGWRQMNNWFNFQGAVTQQDLSINDAANSAFANAQSSYFQNLASLTANAVLKRLQAEAQAKSAKLKQLVSSVGTRVNKVA
jgi:hypothetical protein